MRRYGRIRELDSLPLRTLVLVESPHLRYFVRVPGGWHASDEHGATDIQHELVAELPGWPRTLSSRDLRRPVHVVGRVPELELVPELIA